MQKYKVKQQCKILSENDESYQKVICNKISGLGNKLENKDLLKLLYRLTDITWLYRTAEKYQ